MFIGLDYCDVFVCYSCTALCLIISRDNLLLVVIDGLELEVSTIVFERVFYLSFTELFTCFLCLCSSINHI